MSEAEVAGGGAPPRASQGTAGRSSGSRIARARRRRRPIAPLRVAVRAPRAARFDRVHPLWLLGGALVLSAVIHAVVVRGLVRLPSRPRPPRPTTATLRVAVVPKPPPPAPEIPPEPPKIVPRKRLARTPDTPPSSGAPPPPAAPPPPPHPEAPADNRPPVLIAGVSLSATSTTGTLKVGAGNGPVGDRREGTPGQGEGHPEGHPWKAKEFAAPYQLTEEPVFLDNVPPDQIRRYYPEAARREKIEAAVVVNMIVDGDGSVAKVTIVKDPGNGFREAALKVARLYRFKPARVNGRAVATEIPFTIHFELE